MVGIDLLQIARLRRALERTPNLEARLFTEAERAYAAARGNPAQHLAARFCAKEAVAKALELDAWSWQEVEVLGGSGPPVLRLYGAVADRARRLGVEVSISLTHTDTEAAAVALCTPT